jgi:hypothetical protein
MTAISEVTEVLITAFAGDKVALAVDLTPGNATTVVMDGESAVEVGSRRATPAFAELVSLLEGLGAIARCSIPDEAVSR